MSVPTGISLDWSPVTGCKINVQKAPVKLLNVVALLEGKPSEDLPAGQVGTVVEVFAPGVFKVELLGVGGKIIALAEWNRSELLVLKHEAMVAA